jgi:hypothetical protein
MNWDEAPEWRRAGQYTPEERGNLWSWDVTVFEPPAPAARVDE